MAIKLISNYAKRLGLPGYSSHQFSVSVETELTDIGGAGDEISRLYKALQRAVDREIQETGFVPDGDYGLSTVPLSNRVTSVMPNGSGNHHENGAHGHRNGASPVIESWQCSEKQQKLIQNLAKQHKLSDHDLDERAQQLFSLPVRQLNTLSASGLITSLMDDFGGKKNGRSNGSSAPQKGGSQ